MIMKIFVVVRIIVLIVFYLKKVKKNVLSITKRLHYIKIEVPDRSNVGQFKELYRNFISLADGLKVSFDMFIESFKVLYPFDGLVISFSIS